MQFIALNSDNDDASSRQSMWLYNILYTTTLVDVTVLFHAQLVYASALQITLPISSKQCNVCLAWLTGNHIAMKAKNNGLHSVSSSLYNLNEMRAREVLAVHRPTTLGNLG